MIKIFKSRKWEVFDGTREQAIKHITDYLKEIDYLDCDNCWDEYVELYDSDAEDITVFAAYYSGWGNGEKLYPVNIEYGTKEYYKRILSSTYANRKWEHYLTQLDPRKDYIIV